MWCGCELTGPAVDPTKIQVGLCKKHGANVVDTCYCRTFFFYALPRLGTASREVQPTQSGG